MICTVQGCQQHYGCRLRAKGIQVSPAATPNQSGEVHRRPFRPMVEPGWQETTKLYDHRPGGTAVPIHRPDGTQATMKDYAENRRHYDDRFRLMNENRST